MTNYAKKLAKVCQWDPAEEGLEPAIDISKPAIIKLAVEFLEDKAPKIVPKILKGSSKDTIEEALDEHPMSNLYLTIMGTCTPEQLLEVSLKDIESESNRRPFLKGDTIKEYVDTLRELQTGLTEHSKTISIETTIGTLTEFDEEKDTKAINKVLAAGGMPTFSEILENFGSVIDARDHLQHAMAALDGDYKELEAQLEATSKELSTTTAKLLAAGSSVGDSHIPSDWDGTLPEGKVKTANTKDLFPEELEGMSGFDIPTFEWEGYHPMVPKVDDKYIFRPRELRRVLYALAFNKRAWLQGETGSGKTTLVEQVAARLGWPVIRENLDSEITRGDLIGRDTLTTDADGNPVSRFVEGSLPQALRQPCIMLLDELDAVRPDVSYVLQSVLEGKSLKVSEDGGQVIEPHPLSRLVATANTVGQGDENGRYPAVRAQSLAMLDRFTVFIKVDYMKDTERKQLLTSTFPMLKEKDSKAILQYFSEHLTAFQSGDIVQPISPRGLLAIGEATAIMGDAEQALEMVVLDKASDDDKSALKGIVQRVCG